MAMDYEIHPEEWQTTIDNVTTAKQEMEDSAEEMRNIIKASLVGAGMTGEVADQLAEAYDREVLSSARQFADTVEQQIQTNKDNLEKYNTMQEEASSIASR